MASRLPLSDLLPFVFLHDYILDYFNGSGNANEAEFNRLMTKYGAQLTDPNPFVPVKNKDFSAYPQEKNDIRVNKHKDYPTIEFTKEHVEGILAMSNAFNLSEGECVRYFVAANRADCRRMAEQYADVPLNSLETSIMEVSAFLFLLENSKLLDILLLFIKHRMSTSSIATNRAVRKSVVVSSNRWLTGGLITNLAKAVREGWVEISNPVGAIQPAVGTTPGTAGFGSSKGFFARTFRIRVLQQLVDSMFYIAMTTQILPAEFSQIFDLIQSISNSVIDATPPSEFLRAMGGPDDVAKTSGAGTTVPTCEDNDDWKRLGIRLIVILQLSYVSILSHKVELLHRNINEEPYSNGDVGNTLELPFHLDRTNGNGKSAGTGDVCWRSTGVRGFCFLVHATHLQQLVDSERESSDRVVRYLFEAVQSRAFTYLRLVLVPIVLSMVSSGEESGKFYMEIIQDIVMDMTFLFAVYPLLPDPHYPDPSFVGYVRCKRIAQFRASNPACDCLDDIMNLIALVCSVWPSLALHFAKESSDTPADMVKTTDLQHPAVSGRFLYHPFFDACRLVCFEDRAVMRAFVNMCRGIATYNISANPSLRSKFGVNTMAVYAFLRAHEVSVGPQREDWSLWGFFICFFNEFASQLKKTLVVGNADQGKLFAPGYRGTEQQGSSQVLSKADADFLVDIADLVASVAICPEVAKAMLRDCNPIPALFDLVSCPVPIAVKGAIFRALAALANANGECVQDIWARLETHNILQSSSMQSLVNRPAVARAPNGNRQHHHHQHHSSHAYDQLGLRSELEGAESTAGVYPCTDGFLRLLEALLSHGIPSDLGTGKRLPGILPYLEFVIEDVLGRASARYYAPAGQEGEAQRWRLTATGTNILCLILKQYDINSLYHLETENGLSASQMSAGDIYGSASAFTSGSRGSTQQSISELSADFLDIPASYACTRSDGTTHACKLARLKSMGFILMAMLLGGTSVSSGVGGNPSTSHLLSFLLKLLEDCSIPKLKSAVSQICLQATDSSLSIFCVLQPPERPQLELLYGSDKNLAEFGLLGTTNVACDGSYWKEKTVASCIGLLYECSLREYVFNHFIHRSATPVSYARFVNNRPMSIPVVTQSLALAMGATSQLSKIGHFLQLQDPRVECYPSISGMVACLLEHIAVQLPTQVFRGAIKESDHDSADLMNACVAVLHSTHYGSLFDNSNISLSKVVLRANDPFPVYFYSTSYLDSCRVSVKSNMSELTRWILMHGDENWHLRSATDSFVSWNKASIQSDVPLAMHTLKQGIMSASENVYGLIFASLSPTSLCFAHYLLGLQDAMEYVLHGTMLMMGGSDQDIATHASTMIKDSPSPNTYPVNCLGAIIESIMPNTQSNTIAGSLEDCLVIKHPSSAMLAYELIYKLCSYPVTSAVVLAYLRKRSINFLTVQLALFTDLCQLTNDEICRLKGLALPSVGIDTDIEQFKTTRNHCLGWLLSIFAIELRVLCSAQDTAVRKISLLLGSVFSVTDASRSRRIPLVHFLSAALDLPSDQFTEVSSPIALQCIDKATVPHQLSRLARRPKSINLRDEKTNDLFSGFSIVDISALTRLLEEAQVEVPLRATQVETLSQRDLVNAIQATVEMNVYQLRLASSTHLIVGLSKLIEVTVLEDLPGKLTILGHNASSRSDSDAEVDATAVQGFFSEIVSPLLFATFGKVFESQTSRTAGTNPFSGLSVVEMIMAEKLMHAILACIHSMRKRSLIAQAKSIPLTESQHIALLQFLCHAIAPKGSPRSVTSVGRPKTSVYFRGLVYSAIAVTLGTRNSSPSRDFDLSEPAASNTSTTQELAISVAPGSDCAPLHLAVLKLWAADVVAALMADACIGPVVWRVVATTTASIVLSSIWSASTTSDQEFSRASLAYDSTVPVTAAMISPTYSQALYATFDKGHAQQLISTGIGAIGRRLLENSDSESELERKEYEDRELGLLEATLNFCSQLAETADGVNILLQSKIFARMMTLNHLIVPVTLPPLDHDQYHVLEAAHEAQEQHFLQSLRLFRIMVNTNNSIEVASGILQFLKRFRNLVLSYLAMQSLSLRGLRVLKSLLSVLAATAMVNGSLATFGDSLKLSTELNPLKKSKSDTSLASHVGQEILFDSILQGDADVFTTDICFILVNIGSNPIPGCLSSVNGSKRNIWWETIAPSDENEILLATTASAAPSGLQIDPVLARSWNQFEDVKLSAGLEILRQAAMFLRIRAESLLTGTVGKSAEPENKVQSLLNSISSIPSAFDRGNISLMKTLSGLISFDLRGIAEVFCICSRIARSGNHDSTAMQIKAQWLQGGPSFVRSSALPAADELENDDSARLRECTQCINIISENLICVVHAFVVTGDQEDIKKWRMALRQADSEGLAGVSSVSSRGAPRSAGSDIAACVLEAEQLPDHCFQRVVARWIRGIMDA